MKPENIALFKRFLKTEGCNSLFAGLYSQSRPKDAPENVEDFLRQIDARDAILGAFIFPEDGKSDFGVNYWFEKAVKWEKCLQSATASQFYGYCWHNKESIQREADKPLNKVTAYLHAPGIEPKGIVKALQTPNYTSSSGEKEEYIKALSEDSREDTPPQKLDAWKGRDFKKEEPKAEIEQEFPKGVTEEQMALSGFTKIPLNAGSPKTRIPNGFISLNSKSGYFVTFNITISEEIRKSAHKYVHVFSKEGAIYLLFDDAPEDAVAWRSGDSNVKLSSKALIEGIKEFFNIKEDNFRLAISKNMAKTKNNLFYKVTYKK